MSPIQPVKNSQLVDAVQAGKPVEIRGYTLTESYQKRLEGALELCLLTHDKKDLLPIVNSVVQELVLWSSMAIMRQIYFADHDLNIGSISDAEENEADFQRSITYENMQSYREKAQVRGLFLNTRIVHNQAGIRLEVYCNARHPEHQEDRLRLQLRQAMEYEDVMDYFKDNPQDGDGRHLGLAFSVLMLREENLRPELMRMGHEGEVMTSRLEIPFDRSFRSIRDRIMNDELLAPFESAPLIPAGVVVEREDGKSYHCPICNQDVSEKVFFQDVPVDMVDAASVHAVQPDWKAEDGACASCIAIYGAEY